MSIDKPLRKINELVAALTAVEQGQRTDRLGLEGLEAACEEARELYERLIVLRHKAREASVVHEPATPVAAVPFAPVASQTKEPVATATAAEPQALRLDTRPAPDKAPRQTSLIEAIASTELEPVPTTSPPAAPPVAPSKAAEPKAAPRHATSVAEKLEKAAFADLGKAISLSHKFWFVAELFNGDRVAFDAAVERLDRSAGLAEAERFLKEGVIAKLKKAADPEALATFTDLVKRRHT